MTDTTRIAVIGAAGWAGRQAPRSASTRRFAPVLRWVGGLGKRSELR